MLIENNIYCIKSFIINFVIVSAHILSCGITIIINAKNHLQFLKCNILAKTTTFISPKFKAFANFW